MGRSKKKNMIKFNADGEEKPFHNNEIVQSSEIDFNPDDGSRLGTTNYSVSSNEIIDFMNDIGKNPMMPNMDSFRM